MWFVNFKKKFFVKFFVVEKKLFGGKDFVEKVVWSLLSLLSLLPPLSLLSLPALLSLPSILSHRYVQGVRE